MEVGDEQDVAVVFVGAAIKDPLAVGRNGKTLWNFLVTNIGSA